MRKFTLYMFLLLSFLWAKHLSAQIRAVDGDSLERYEQRIRLNGIDAPEFWQICYNAQGNSYDCGQQSWHYLEHLINNAATECECLPEPDKYGRSICECFANGQSINAEMVAKGWARTYRDNKKYAEQEQEAKTAKRGIWQGKHMHPAIYRVLAKEALQK